MAIVGHWAHAFPIAYLLPQASVTLLCKLSMMSDAICGLLLVLRLEDATVYPWYVATPPPSTVETIEAWKTAGKWAEGPDPTPGKNGFTGFPVVFPFYINVSYSHSMEGMAIVSLAIIAVMLLLRYKVSLGYALGMVLAAVGHPVVDMFFHDAYVLMGNRIVTRVGVNFWQIPWMGPVAFALETGAFYGTYRLWRSNREPVNDDKETSDKIAHYEKKFWMLAMTHNMASFYIQGPIMTWFFYTYFPDLQAFTPAAYWSFCLFAVMMWTWSFALYPLYKLEGLTVCKRSMGKVEGDCYVKVP